MDMDDAILAEGISYKYGADGEFTLRDMSFSVKKGEFTAVLGHSGCGKSTLLSLVMGLIFPQSGGIFVNGAPVLGGGTDRAIVFQDCSLFPWMTARDNVAFGAMEARRLPKAQARMIADMTLDMVGLCAGKDKYPSELSGGMKQRASIARLLAMDSDIWLFDEPFSALDPDIRKSLQTLTADMAKDKTSGKTVLFVTHNVDEAIIMSERILFMDKGRFTADIEIPFSYPRSREIVRTKEYFALSDKLARMFYESRPHR